MGHDDNPQRREHPNVGDKHQAATTRPGPTGSAASTTARAKLWLSHPGSTARESTPASAASPDGAVRGIRRCADNHSEPAAAPSDPAPTPTAAAGTTPTTTAAAGSATPSAARRSSSTSKRNPDRPAAHHGHWVDPPDSSCTAECGAASSAQSPDGRRCRLFAAHRHPNRPDSNSTCTTCPDCPNDTTSRRPVRVQHPATVLTSHYHITL